MKVYRVRAQSIREGREIRFLVIGIMFSVVCESCTRRENGKRTTMDNPSQKSKSLDAALNTSKVELATFGSGCFWCVEAIFGRFDGVVSVASGYAGGTVESPTYEQICTGTTGHAEVCQIRFNSRKINYDQLLEVFWQTHDPTTLNRQGNDRGTQYRSVIFYHDRRQQELAEQSKKKLTASGIWANPIVTEIVPFKVFFEAEPYHQDYYEQNLNHPYCTFVIRPKLDKLYKTFKSKLKKAGE